MAARAPQRAGILVALDRRDLWDRQIAMSAMEEELVKARKALSELRKLDRDELSDDDDANSVGTGAAA